MISISNLITRSQYLTNKIVELEQIIKNAPEGILISRARNSRYYYTKKIRLTDGTVKETYLRKAQQKEAIDIANKMFAENELPKIRKEKELVDRMIQFYSEESSIDSFESLHPGIRQLLSTKLLLTNPSADNWKHAPYNRSQNYPEQLIYSTVVPGLLVRSKSEADILARLEYFQVPYHYEEIEAVNNEMIAIDFKCLNIRTNQIWWWDHRGMMDNEAYIRKTLHCEALFYRAGIVPWVNLIVTSETKYHPLDIQWVDQIIQHYLL